MPGKAGTRKFYKKGKVQKKTGSRSLSFFILMLGLVVLVYTFSFVKRLTQTEAVGSPEPILVRMEILNGCGVPGAGQDVREYLLDREFEGVVFDVINVGNFTDTQMSQTLIWDRVGEEKIALRVAQLLGIEKDKVSYHPLENNYLEIKVTLILGSDYQKIFREEKS
jgi:hypothetical protein